MSFKKNQLISGINFKNYKKQLVSYANNVKDDIKAIKFKLDLTPIRDQDRLLTFEEYSKIYDTLAGTAEKTVNHFLFNLILNGFRIFPNKTDTLIYVASTAYRDDEFKRGISEFLGFDLEQFIPSVLISKLSKSVRSTGGKDNSFSEEVLLSEYMKTFAKGKFTVENKEKIQELFKIFIPELIENFGSYAEVREKIELACEKIDCAFKKAELTLPSLKNMYQKSLELTKDFYEGATIAYDPDFVPFEYELEQEPHLAVAVILSHKDEKSDVAKYVKANFTTENFNGLSWLLNAGLELFRNKEVETLCKYFAVPEEKKEQIRKLKDIALSIPVISEKASERFSKFSQFRSMLGGHLDSWISNYVKRLGEVQKLITDLPEKLELSDCFIKNGKDFLTFAGLNREEIIKILGIFNDQEYRKSIKISLAKLLGEEKGCSKDDFEKVEDFSTLINRFATIRNQLFNILDQAVEFQNPDFASLKKEAGKTLEGWKEFDKLPKINRLSGGTGDPESELKKMEELLPVIIQDHDAYFKQISDYLKVYNLSEKELLDRIEEKEKDLLLKAKKDVTEYNTREIAFRRILSHIANAIRFSDDQISKIIKDWFSQNEIFKKESYFNKYFNNKQGLIYKSPFNVSRKHSVYELKDGLNNYDELVASLKKLYLNIDCNENRLNPTYLSLKLAIENTILYAGEKSIPHDLAQPILPKEYKDLISSQLKFELAKENCEPAVIKKILSLYKSLIYTIQVKFKRERFYLRNNFCWLENHSLFYKPKDVDWFFPERYKNNELFKTFIDKGIIIFRDADKTNVNVLNTFEKITENLDKVAKLEKLLIQLPHDWFYRLPLKEKKTDRKMLCLEVSKDFISKNKRIYAVKNLNLEISARLIGPSVMKQQLDQILGASGKITFGDFNYLCDQKIAQRNDEEKITISPQELTQCITVPIKIEGSGGDPERKAPFENLIAIDQGEYGFSFAVFSLKDAGNEVAEPIAVDTVPMKTIRQFNRTVDAFRKGHKETLQKFNQNYSTTAFNYRKKLVGDIFGLIVGLMEKYNAFPVLEHQVSELEEGTHKLEVVYKSTNACFLKNQIEANEADRKTRWFGADFWNTDFKIKRINGEGKEEITDLRLYPGAYVSAYQTSKICHVCGRNLFDLIKQEEIDNPDRLFEIKDGEVEIQGEKIKLYKQPSNDEIVPYLKAKKNGKRRTYNSIKENAPWTEPYESRKPLDFRTFKNLCLRNLRRKPKSQRSVGSSISAYYCVFKDCPCHNQRQHADENAAINIGKRLLSRLIRKKETKA